MFNLEVVENMKNSSGIRKMFEEGERLKSIYGADKVYDFSIGNPDAEPPIEVKQAIKELAESSDRGMHRYMPNVGYLSTRKAVADMLTKDNGVEVYPENVIMTVGAAGALNVALKSILNPGDEVIVLAPYFVEYLFYIKNYQGKPVVVDTDEHFLPDIDKLSKAINSKTKAIIINTPNNPTGVVYSGEVLGKLNDLLIEKEKEFGSAIFVISDEPYVKITYGTEVPGVMSIFKNAIICNSFSKSLALPGERIGFVAANNSIDDVSTLMGAMAFAIRTLGFVNAPAFQQKIIEKAINAKVDVQAYQEKRDILYGALKDCGFELTEPQGAFYLWMKSPMEDEEEFVQYAIDKYQIIMVAGSGFGKKGYVRLTYCISKETIENSIPNFKRLAEDVL